MIDPDDVERYNVLWGDSCEILAGFMPGKIDSIYAEMYSTPGLGQTEDEFRAYARRFCAVLYDVLADSGSLFVAVAEQYAEAYWKMMVTNEPGWIRQNDTMPVLHCTKSDYFYRKFDDAPLVVHEDADTRNRLAHATQVGPLEDMVCSAFTPPGGITLDPTAGSGTHLVAALQRGRRAIGIDRDMKSVGQTSGRLALLGGWNHARRPARS